MNKFKETPTLAMAVKRTLSVLMTFATDELQWIEANPAFGMDQRRRRRKKEDERGDREDRGQKPLEETQIATVWKANPLGTRRRAIFEALLATGFRRGDSRRVPSSTDDSVIVLLTNKTGELVVVGITRNLRAAAAAWNQSRAEAGLKPSAYLICAERGTPLHARTVSREISAAFAAAGLPGTGLHSLRYTAAVRLIKIGFSYDDIAEHLGHSLAATASSYCRKRRRARLRAKAIDEVDKAMHC